MRNRLFFLTFLAVAAITHASSAAAFSVRINQPKIELELAPGEAYSGEIQVENTEDSETLVKIYPLDWVYAEGGSGDKIFGPVGSQPLSAGRWLTFVPAEGKIPPFGRLTVKYTLKVPDTAMGGYYTVLFFETMIGTAQNEEGAAVNVAGRIGALLFIEIQNTAKRTGKIESLDIRPGEGNKPLEIATTFRNTGNVAVVLGGNFIIMDAEGQIQARGDLSNIYTSPGTSGTAVTQWVGRLPKGRYDALVTYELGKGVNLVEERKFSVE